MYDRLNVRGLIVEATIKAERALDSFLSDFFCKDEFTGWELNEMLWYTERITLAAKKDILFIILGRYHKHFLNDNPEFKDMFDRVVPHRNIFAHSEIDTFENIGDSNFILIFKKYKEGKPDFRKYDRKLIEDLLTKLNIITEKISKLSQQNLPALTS